MPRPCNQDMLPTWAPWIWRQSAVASAAHHALGSEMVYMLRRNVINSTSFACTEAAFAKSAFQSAAMTGVVISQVVFPRPGLLLQACHGQTDP